LNRLVRFLWNRNDVDPRDIRALAIREMCPVLLHAAAFDSSLAKIPLIEPLVSYRSLVMNREYNPDFIHAAVAGALEAYDLPDLAASLAPRNRPAGKSSDAR
jgi:hypothetical protein